MVKFKHLKCISRASDFTIEDGPDLPEPKAGHCQLHFDKDKIFIYGGITTSDSGNLTYTNRAYVWSNGNWLRVPAINPCDNDAQDLSFQQPCTSRVEENRIEVIVVTFYYINTCTSILNLLTNEWTTVHSSEINIPIGGHLVASLDKSRVFYLGGLYYKQEETQSLDVYELNSDGWRMIEAKLPFGIASNVTKSYPSLHNVTLH